MYSLRQVLDLNEDQSRVTNSLLGSRYSFFHKDQNPKAWNELFQVRFNRDPQNACKEDAEEILCRGFVMAGDGASADEIFPLFTHSEYYIVMPNGQTYERLSI
jgi:hypothetical protein